MNNKASKLTINQLGFTSNLRNSLVVLMVQRLGRGQVNQLTSPSARRRQCEALGDEFTVRDLMDVINHWHQQNQQLHGIIPFVPQVERAIADKLIAQGFTQLDWVALPPSTVTVPMLQALGKRRIKGYSVLVLGTLSHKALRVLEKVTELHSPNITIGQLLQLSRYAIRREHYGDIGMSLDNTRAKLIEIGFGYKDGPFIQAGTKRELAEEMVMFGLPRRSVQQFIEYAQRRCWIGELLD
jgi:hypothetical protein